MLIAILYPLNGIQIRINIQGCYKYRKTLSIYVKVKQSHYRPGVAQRVPGI